MPVDLHLTSKNPSFNSAFTEFIVKAYPSQLCMSMLQYGGEENTQPYMFLGNIVNFSCEIGCKKPALS